MLPSTSAVDGLPIYPLKRCCSIEICADEIAPRRGEIYPRCLRGADPAAQLVQPVPVSTDHTTSLTGPFVWHAHDGRRGEESHPSWRRSPSQPRRPMVPFRAVDSGSTSGHDLDVEYGVSQRLSCLQCGEPVSALKCPFTAACREAFGSAVGVIRSGSRIDESTATIQPRPWPVHWSTM
jgi:hypothetical protein